MRSLNKDKRPVQEQSSTTSRRIPSQNYGIMVILIHGVMVRTNSFFFVQRNHQGVDWNISNLLQKSSPVSPVENSWLTNRRSLPKITQHISGFEKAMNRIAFFYEASRTERNVHRLKDVPAAEKKAQSPVSWNGKTSTERCSLEYIHGPDLRYSVRAGHISTCPIRVVPRVQARPFRGRAFLYREPTL